MKLTAIPLAIIIFVILFGGIGATTAMNWWQTESSKVPVTYTEGAAAGQYNPVDIRGSYVFGDVSKLFEVPLADLKAAFLIPDGSDPASYPLKSLETQFADQPVEIGTGSVRMFVALYKGLPYEIADDTYLTEAAVSILKQQGKLTPEQTSYIESHTLIPGQAASAPQEATLAPTAVPGAAATATVHVVEDKKVGGATTFQNLLDWGVSKEAIEKIIGGSMPAPQTIIKDYYTQKAIEFSSGKTALQAEVDKTK